MSLLDWIIVLVFLLLVAFAKVPLSAMSLAALVLVIIVCRVLKGEKLK